MSDQTLECTFSEDLSLGLTHDKFQAHVDKLSDDNEKLVEKRYNLMFDFLC